MLTCLEKKDIAGEISQMKCDNRKEMYIQEVIAARMKREKWADISEKKAKERAIEMYVDVGNKSNWKEEEDNYDEMIEKKRRRKGM